MQKLKKGHKALYKIKKALFMSSVASMALFGCGKPSPKVSENKEQDTTKVETLRVDSVKKSVRNVGYYNDTLDVATSTIMCYVNGKILRFYVEGKESFRMQLPYFVHEDWHHHNDLMKYRYKYLYSPYEYYKLCMHDEISANIAAILTERYEYLASDNKKEVIGRYKNTYAEFYFNAIKSGKINPEDMSSEKREEEWKFIANGTRDMWMEKFANRYSQRSFSMLKNYINRVGLVRKNTKNYNFIKQKMYEIGGVDFNKYMDGDIEYKYDKTNLAQKIREVSSLQTNGKYIFPYIENGYDLLKNVEYGKQKEALQHLMISAKLKSVLSGISKDNLISHPQIVSSCYDRIVGSFLLDKSFSEFIEKYEVQTSVAPVINKKGGYEEALKKYYTVNGVDLRTIISDFNERKLPVVSSMNFADNIILYPNDFSSLGWNNEDISVAAELKDNVPAPKQNDVVKRHRMSDKMYIDLPNFREAILVNCSKEQQEQIYTMIRDFGAIPAVLKGCNTKKRNEYLMQYELSQKSR